MKLLVGMFSAGVGVVFFVLANIFYYQPSLFSDYGLDSLFSTNQSKARAAVARLLLNPKSAKFAGLQTIDAEAQKYVCGNVDAKDKSGNYAGNRAFVYTVKIDFARIDDDGQIAQRHAAYKECPESDAEKYAHQKMGISPGALSALSTISKAIPPGDPSTLTTLAAQMSPSGAGGANSSGASTQQLLGQLGGQPSGGAGQQSNAPFKADNAPEREWRGDHPPAVWPVFAQNDPLAQPAQKRTTAETMALAKQLEEREAQFKTGKTKTRPPLADVRDTLRALLTIDPKEKVYPEAWAAFVRLRKIEREQSQTEASR
jgi:hypothetical protein